MLLVGVCAMASDTSVKNADGVEIWYDFDSESKTASVTYRGDDSNSYSREYTGEVVIPSTVTYNGVEYSVTSIGDYAFYWCTGLTSITLPEGLTSIGDDAFNYCSALTSITLPDGLKSIGNSAFSDCRGLTSITLPDGLTSIGDDAFSYCSGLTSITLPEGLTSIGDDAFFCCYKLYEVYNKSDLTITAGSRENGEVARFAKNVYTDSEVVSKLKTVGDYVFYVDGEEIELLAYIGEETSITLPSDYEGKNYKIGDYAFYLCSALTSITLPEGLTTIGERAFSNCSALISITLPEGVTSIGGDAFSGTALRETESNWVDGVLYIDNYLIEAKSSISGEYAVKEGTMLIADQAFSYCFALTSVTIPESVMSIGDCAFSATVTSIDVALNCDYYTSVDGVLFSKDKTTLIHYPIGKKATSYSVPNGVTSIGKRAFSSCSALTSITLPEGLTSIEDDAFSYCFALTSITLPDGLITIGVRAFSYCGKLTSIMLSESVTSIGKQAFDYCSALTSITLPESVTSIGDNAFKGCSGLTSITSKNATPPTVEGYYTLGDVDKTIPVYVPAESVEAYKRAERWKVFTNIQAIDESLTSIVENVADNVSVRFIGNTIVVEGTDDYTVYTVSGRNIGKVESVERGIYIVVANGNSYKVIAK